MWGETLFNKIVYYTLVPITIFVLVLLVILLAATVGSAAWILMSL